MEDRKDIQSALLGAWLFLMLISIIISACAPLPLFASEVDSQVKIGQTLPATFPIIIDQPGNYVLSNNITVFTSGKHGIEIRSDDVTLNLHGNTIAGPGDLSGTGISASQRDNIEIKNGTVQGFSCGINLSGSNHQVRDIRAFYNKSCGIEAASSIISNCLANSNGSEGIKADSATITNCTANFNGSLGLRVSASTVIDCVANSNGSHGIYAVNKCRIEKNIMRDNGGYGLYLEPDYSYAINNKAVSNAVGNFYQSGTHYLPASGNEANSE